MLAFAITASALAPGTFEGSDGNMAVGAGSDWATPGLVVAKKGDLAPGAGDDSFGQGTKEDTPVPSVVSGSIPPNKSDLQRLYVSTENVEDPAHPGDANFNVDMLYLGWTRVQDPSGTTNMDFELNQLDQISANGVTPVRKAGDVLITYDLSRGGTVPTISIHKWIDTGAASNCEASSSLPCWDKAVALAPPKSEGGINGGPITDVLNANAALSARTFGEAAINLQASGIFGSGCTNFGSAYVKSRSSDSFTAAVKDFIAPVPTSIDSCPNRTIKLKKLGPGGSLLSGATLQLWRDTTGDGLTNDDVQVAPDGWVSGSKDCTTTSDGIGNCVFTIGVAGTYIGHESAAPPGYSLTAGDVSQVITLDKTSPAPYVLTFQDNPQPGDFTVHKRDAGGTNPLNATFTLYNDVDNSDTVNAGDTVVDSQATGTDGDYTFTGLPPGEYVVKETTPPTGYDAPTPDYYAFTIGIAAGGDSKSFTFNDTPTPGSISLLKRDAATEAPLDGAHFTLWQDTNGNGTFEPTGAAPDTAIDSSCITGVLGTCTYSSLAPGTYFVQETQAPSGYDLPSPDYQKVVIAIAAGGDDKSVTFDDPLTKGSITVHKQDDDNEPAALDGATFALYADANADGEPDGAALATCESGDDGTDSGECTFDDLAPGTYLVEETAAPTGYDLPPLADRIQTVVIVKADGGDDHTITFTDPRKFRVIVLVCKEADDSLYPSGVTLDGVGPLTSVDAAGLPAGVSQAEACDIDGAKFTGKHYGIYAGSVDIGQ